MKKVFFLAFAFIGLCSFNSVEISSMPPDICGENATRVWYDCGSVCQSGTDANGNDRPLTFNEYMVASDRLSDGCPQGPVETISPNPFN